MSRTRSDKTEIRHLRRLLRETVGAMTRALHHPMSAAAHAEIVHQRREIEIALMPRRRARREGAK